MSDSFWQAEVGLPHDSPDDDPIDRTVEVCIVGGGIVGAGLAHWLARAGLSGLIVEARAPAMGASGRNAGFILSGVAGNYAAAVQAYGRDAARAIWALSIANRDLMLDLADGFGVPVERCGSLLLAETEAEAEALARSAALLAEDGLPGEFFPHDPLDRGFLAAIRRPDDGVTHPVRLSRALLAASGFDVVTHAPVVGFEETSDAVRVRTARGTIRARWLLLATNAWSATLHPYFAGKVWPMRGQIYVTAPAPLRLHTAGYSHYGYWYFRQVPDPARPGAGRWLLGGGRHLHFDTENHTLDEQPTPAVQADLEAWTARYFPEFSGLPVERRWAGLMGFTPDGLPLVGRLPGHWWVAFCVGFNGHGMSLGVTIARQAVRLLLHGEPPGPFDAQRLEA